MGRETLLGCRRHPFGVSKALPTTKGWTGTIERSTKAAENGERWPRAVRRGVRETLRVPEMKMFKPLALLRSWLQILTTEVKQRLMDHAPAVLKDVTVTVAGVMLFRRRRGRDFRESLIRWNSMRDLPREDLLKIQTERTREMISYASTRSRYYAAKYAQVSSRNSRPPDSRERRVQAHIDDIVIRGSGKLRKGYTAGRRESHWSSSARKTAMESGLLDKRPCGRCMSTSSVAIASPGSRDVICSCQRPLHEPVLAE